MGEKSALESLRLELRRGSLVLAVLAALKQEQYGYTLCRLLNDRGMSIEESTVYPLLRRLEAQGLLESQWREENRRRKRFYCLSDAGREVLESLTEEWQTINQSLNRLL